MGNKGDMLVHSASESSLVLRSRPLVAINDYFLFFFTYVFIYVFFVQYVFSQVDTGSSFELVDVLSSRTLFSISAQWRLIVPYKHFNKVGPRMKGDVAAIGLLSYT